MHAPKPNLSKEERKALSKLKRDNDRIVLTAEKGVAIVVLDKKEYIEKAQTLLAQPAYRTMERDPTNKFKAKLITMLRKNKKGIRNGKKISTNPCILQVALPPSFIGYP